MEGNRNQVARTMREIPEEIEEYLDRNSYQFDELIGPLSSIFWLAGLDKLVDAMYDPSIVLQDEVRAIPINVRVTWILEHLIEEGKVPRSMYDRYFFGFDQPPVVIMPIRLDPIPSQVGYRYALQRTEELFPAYRPQCLPRDIATVRVKRSQNKHCLTAKILEGYVSKLGGGSFLYRVSTRTALAALMAFFAPVIHNNTLDNELGPGIYTSNSLEWVLRFSSINNALLVFKNTDFRTLEVWNPPVSDWQHNVATWTRKSLSNVPDSVPLESKTADVTQGPISESNSRKNCLPAPGKVSQRVAASYAGCVALSASLAIIIWFE
ncbi:Amino acid transporter, transmembrane [Penicillium digitatum]|uniref:Amino acid transporter, transmembrane n=1 Tax=Penicillium digitatum TaxID=36651 RepID=A0A7T7BLJ2_PENDI|nr:hypothetical protein PDIDSM_4638 [Penicillium digitatum]QQK44221.1 Amino acid transporter, transmembrane [Penicillium digitatum]